MEELQETSVLEFATTQPAAKAGRNETSPKVGERNTASDDDPSDIDFEAAYSADANAEEVDDSVDSLEPAPDADQVKVTTPPATEQEDIAFEVVGNEPDDLNAVDVTVVEDEEVASEAPAPKRKGSDTSELAFAQSVRAETAKDQSVISNVLKGTENTLPGATAPSQDSGHRQQVDVAQNRLLEDVQAAHANSTSPKAEQRVEVASRSAQLAETAGKSAVQVTSDSSKTDVDSQPLRQPRDRKDSNSEVILSARSAAPEPVANKATTMPSTPTQTPQSAVLQSPSSLVIQPETMSSDLQLSAIGETDAPSSWDPRAPAATTLTQTLSRPETPGFIGRQMAAALQGVADRPVEVSLNPEELGRVRMSISAAESGITVHVLAERPETLDLMRKHIDQLAREFQELGYENINFAFNEGQTDGGSPSQDGTDDASIAQAASIEAPAEEAIPLTIVPSSGVDVRV